VIRRGTWLTAGISLLAALLAAPPSALAAPGDLTAVQVSKAHQVTRGEGVTVCEIDSIFDTSHPDLVGADVSMGADLTHARLSDFVGDPQKDHGTAMTALIVGQGSGPDRKEGTLGTAPKARVVFVQVDLSKAPAARDGIKECADLGADVINVSLARVGGAGSGGVCPGSGCGGGCWDG